MSRILDRADVFVFFGMLAILAVVLSSGAESTPGESPVSAQAEQLEPVEPPIACHQALVVGGKARVMEPAVRVRRSAGYVAKDDAADTLHYLQKGDVVLIQGGAEMKDGLCWWQVKHQGKQGWTADHSRSGTLLLEAAP